MNCRLHPMIVAAGALVLAVRFAFGQAEAPPERETKASQERLPKLDVPPPKTKGKLTVQFVGVQAFNEKQLRAAIAREVHEIEDSGLDAANAYDASFFLESFYRKAGYSAVSVAAQVTGPWALRLTVNEGPLTRVGVVSVPGAKSHTMEELTNYLLGPTRERFPRIKKDTELPFVQSDVQNGAQLVTRLHTAEGFLDAVIDSPVIALSGDRTSAAITLRIEEGTQYWFGALTFAGELLYPRDELANAIAEERGLPFTPGRLIAAQRKLEDFYKKRGYFLAKVEPRGDKENARAGMVPVTFTITPGARHRFDGFVLRGLDRVRPQFVHNRLAKLRGEIYDPEKIDEKFRELIQTGLFKSLRINPQEAPDNQVRLDLEIEEAKPKEFGIGLGFATYEGMIISASYTDRNFLRTGRPLMTSVEYTSRGNKGELVWSDPWLFESDYRLRLRLYGLNQENDGYSKTEYGIRPTLSRNITKHWEVSAFFHAKQVEITESTIAPSSLLGLEKYRANSIGISTTLDYRNSPANPTRGFVATAAIDTASSALGSEIDFVRTTMRFSYYLPVTPKSVLALGARGGFISPTGRTSSISGQSSTGEDVQLPIDERFFSGGAASVRSFAERTLGPKDIAGQSIGGEAFSVFNIEYTFPIRGDLKGAIFADAGNVRARAGDFGFTDMRYAVGAGLRYDLPFGPIRLDYGLNPSPHADEDRGAFHFSFGVAF